jgi:hypothetical protein
MFHYPQEPLRLKDLFTNGWVLFLDTYRFSWIWAFLNALLFLVSDYFTTSRISNLIYWKHFAYQINLAIIIIIFIVPWSFLRSIIMVHMHFYAIGETKSFSHALKITLKKIIPITITSFVYQAIIILGLFLFILPGIYVGILFFMYLPLLVLDDNSMVDSFINSIKLVLGSWWETFLLTLIPTGLIYLIREVMREYFLRAPIIIGLSIILLTILIPYSYSLTLIQFNNLKKKYNIAHLSTTTSRG